MRNLLSLLLLLCPAVMLFAQTRTISGTVKGADNKETLPQVNVVIKGNTTGAVTDLDGNYTITVPEDAKVLVFSFLGYTEQEIDLSAYPGNAVTINVTLKTTNVGLNTVVVSASKRQEKVLDAPASVTVISMEKIQSQAPLTVADNLKNTPGVDVMMTGLVQSNINIRGFNNIFSGAMLTIVDYRFAAVPSLKVNAFQLIPNNTFDMDRIEVVRGPGSALYGPNAADGVLAIFTRSPLDMPTKYETTVAMSFGFAEGTGKPILRPEFRHAGKIGSKNKFGYKISGSFLQAGDFKYYDPREPSRGDSILFGNVSYGQPFVEDTTLERTTFDRDFNIQNYSTDLRLDYRPNENSELILSGGFSTLNNIELTGLGAGQGINWRYYYAQARYRWKNLFVQYFVNISDAGDTYLIPQVGADAQAPHSFQLLVDKSKQHVGQIQHSWKPISILNFIYGLDAIYTTPNTEGTINGRFEDDDNIFQTGGYVQGELQAHEKLKIVGAFRADYHNRINNVFFSPRAAIVYKVTPKHTLRGTYNRAFSSPQTLNLFLDLSNGLVPNGINIRGIGNASGYDYRYGSNGTAQFRSSYLATNGTPQWYDVGDKSNNYQFFNEITTIIANGLAGATGFPSEVVNGLVSTLLTDIAGPTGSIQNVDQITVDYVKLAGGATIAESSFDIADFSTRKGIDNQITQTMELGYKGILGDKVFVTLDGYYTRINNYVGPLTLASASVLFEPNDLLNALGDFGPGGQLYDNIENSGFKSVLIGLLDDNPSYQDPTGSIQSVSGEVWDELAYILSAASRQIPVGTVTPDNELVGSDVILTYVNLGNINVAGFDFAVNYYARPDLNFSGSFSYVNKNKIPLAGAQGGFVGLNAPKYKTAVSAEYTNSKARLTTRATWRWQDGFPANSSVYVGDVKAANLVDLNVNYKVHGVEGLNLTVDVNNLFNYQFQRFPGTPQIGTVLIGKVTYTFTEKTFTKNSAGTTSF
jgi:outer membrane receptor for ferrienterochelin and colicins